MGKSIQKLACMMGALALVLFGFSRVALAQEHPEHPKAKPAERVTISKEALAEAITDFITKDSDLKGGYFVYYDQKTKTPLILTLDKVHKEKLAKVDEDRYFACSDFKATDGKTYDLDFFMNDTDAGLQVSEMMVHKVNGKPRYNWAEENGLWIRK